MEFVVFSPTDPPISIMAVIVLKPGKLQPVAFRAFEGDFQTPAGIINGADFRAGVLPPKRTGQPLMT